MNMNFQWPETSEFKLARHGSHALPVIRRIQSEPPSTRRGRSFAKYLFLGSAVVGAGWLLAAASATVLWIVGATVIAVVCLGLVVALHALDNSPW
jgi:hypothetical protein